MKPRHKTDVFFFGLGSVMAFTVSAVMFNKPVLWGLALQSVAFASGAVVEAVSHKREQERQSEDDRIIYLDMKYTQAEKRATYWETRFEELQSQRTQEKTK